jgi:hypothetical protein
VLYIISETKHWRAELRNNNDPHDARRKKKVVKGEVHRFNYIIERNYRSMR